MLKINGVKEKIQEILSAENLDDPENDLLELVALAKRELIESSTVLELRAMRDFIDSEICRRVK